MASGGKCAQTNSMNIQATNRMPAVCVFSGLINVVQLQIKLIN